MSPPPSLLRHPRRSSSSPSLVVVVIVVATHSSIFRDEDLLMRISRWFCIREELRLLLSAHHIFELVNSTEEAQTRQGVT